MKKQYNQPAIIVAEMMPEMAVLTTSNYRKSEEVGWQEIKQW